MNNRYIPTLLFLGVFFLGIVLAPKIGPAWDEPDNIVAAGQYAKFFQKGFKPDILTQTDQDASIFGHVIYTQEPAIARYPPLPYYLGTIIALITHAQTSQEIIVAFHIATVLFFALLVATVYAWGQLLGLSRLTSLFAALLTFLYPTLFGHGLSNLKDTAQVSLFTLSLYFLVKKQIKTGSVMWGLALASKFNAIYVPIIWTIWMASSLKRKQFFSFFIFHFSFFIAVGLLTAFTVWPYLWFDPLPRIMEVVHYFTSVGQGYKIFWNGVMYTVGVGKALWWYPWMNLLYTTPPLLTILWAIGMVTATKHPRYRILAIWFVLPLLRAFFPHAAFYDGVRHFLETLPAAILIAAIGFTQLVKFVKLDKLGKTILTTLIVGQLLYINMTYFPYSTGYLNGLAKNPNDRFDRDIEALSVKESVDYLHKKYGSIHIWAHIGGHLSWHYLVSPDHYTYPEGADSIIIVNKASHIRQGGPYLPLGPEFTLDHMITRGDAIFAWIYRRK